MNIITIGKRCTTDSFLNKYKLRKFSGPFSYMIIDYESALINISNNFINYLNNIQYIDNSDYKIKYLNHWRMSKNFYINTQFFNLNNNNIYEQDKIILWNHHNMYSEINTFKRRCNRIISLLNNSKCILFYIDKIYNNNNIDEYIINIINITNKYYKYKHKILYIIPFSHSKYNEYNCKLYYENNILIIYLLKSTNIEILKDETIKQKIIGTPLLDTDIKNTQITWDLLYNNIKHLLS